MTLTELRNSKGVGVRELARKMGTSHPIVLRLEEMGTSTVETMESYAKALGVDFAVAHAASLETRKRKMGLLVN